MTRRRELTRGQRNFLRKLDQVDRDLSPEERRAMSLEERYRRAHALMREDFRKNMQVWRQQYPHHPYRDELWPEDQIG